MAGAIPKGMSTVGLIVVGLIVWEIIGRGVRIERQARDAGKRASKYAA
jgi:hypothetical protein